MLKFDSTTKKAYNGVNRLKLSFMSPTTARRTLSKVKNERRIEKMHRFAKSEKKITIKTDHINLPAPKQL